MLRRRCLHVRLHLSTYYPICLAQPSLTDIQAHGGLGHSRAASLGQVQTLSRPSSRQGRSATASPAPDTHPVKSHRSHTSLNLGSIFGRGSRPASPVHEEARPESPQFNNVREHGRDNSVTKRHALFPHHALGRMGEVLGLEEEHKEAGDGWQEFRKGPSFSEARPCCLFNSQA